MLDDKGIKPERMAGAFRFRHRDLKEKHAEHQVDSPAELVEVAENQLPQLVMPDAAVRDAETISVLCPTGCARHDCADDGIFRIYRKIFRTVGDLLSRNYCVAVLECAGGLSEGNSKDPQRLHLRHFDQNVEDLKTGLSVWSAVCPPTRPISGWHIQWAGKFHCAAHSIGLVCRSCAFCAHVWPAP